MYVYSAMGVYVAIIYVYIAPLHDQGWSLCSYHMYTVPRFMIRGGVYVAIICIQCPDQRWSLCSYHMYTVPRFMIRGGVYVAIILCVYTVAALHDQFMYLSYVHVYSGPSS